MNRAAVCAWILCMMAPTLAIAAPCGSYAEREQGTRLEFEADGTAREYGKDGILHASLNHFRQGETLFLRDRESGVEERLRLSSNDRTLELISTDWGSTHYEALSSYVCPQLEGLRHLTQPGCEHGKETACCASGDTNACIRQASGREDTATLKRSCVTRPDACLALIASWEKSANAGSKESFNLYTEKRPLPAHQLRELPLLCERHLTPELCRTTAEQLWQAMRFADSARVLATMCDAHLDEQACTRSARLASIALPERFEPASSLPCGQFQAPAGALTPSLHFIDRGMVELSPESRLRARLENGLVKIRHDKGGDFVFVRLGETMLLGLDDWNRMELYTRTSATPATCQPPVVYQEQALSSNCGPDKDPSDCCRAGDIQGCNRMGTMAALYNDWKRAAEYYASVCAAGVRIGCENWGYTVSKTGDYQGVESGLTRLCRQEKRHVACDILDQNRVAPMVLRFEMERLTGNAGEQSQ